jgi:hypothetical protein
MCLSRDVYSTKYKCMYNLLLISCLAYSLTVNKEAIRSSEESVDFNRATKICISEDGSILRVETHYSPVVQYVPTTSTHWNCFLPLACIYAFRMFLTVNSDSFPTQLYPVSL